MAPEASARLRPQEWQQSSFSVFQAGRGSLHSRLAPATRRYHGRMYRVHKPGYDLETMRAVAVAYRRERQAGHFDGPAREAAMVAFRARHPECERLPASEAVARIIAWAAQEHTAWFWQGVGPAGAPRLLARRQP